VVLLVTLLVAFAYFTVLLVGAFVFAKLLAAGLLIRTFIMSSY